MCKHVKELGALHVAESDCRGDFLAWAFGEIGECIQRAPRCGCRFAVWMGLGFGSWTTGVLEDVTCRTSRVGDWIASDSKTFSLEQRWTWSANPRNQTLELLLCRLSMANRTWSTLFPWTSMESFFVGPGLLESCERIARCGCGTMRSTLVWIGGALAFEGWWLVRTPIDAANWLDDIHEWFCAWVEWGAKCGPKPWVGNESSNKFDHARDRTLPSQTGWDHLEVSFDSIASEKWCSSSCRGSWDWRPHVDHDVQDADFNETRLPSQKYYDQYTGLELDPVGTAAARQSEIDFAWRLKAFEPRPRTEAYQLMGRKPFGMRWIDCNKVDEQRPED